MKSSKLIAMIPARIGSTRLKMKNLALIAGKPMIAHVIEAAKASGVFDQVVLEIQRSVDFYESQLGKGAVTQIIMLPPPMDLGIGFEYIEQNISTDISVLNPFEELNYDQELSIKDQAYCTGAIGAAIEGLKNV